MTEQNWKPLFRTPEPTVTKVLRSPTFLHARDLSTGVIADPNALRTLADRVETLDHSTAPLATVADRVFAAVRFCRERADRLEEQALPTRSIEPSPPGRDGAAPSADTAARERLLVASLHYLVTPLDLVPDARTGGYLDDVLLLAWVFGVAAHELAPHLTDHPAVDGTPSGAAHQG